MKFRASGDPVLYLSNPRGFNSDSRRQFLDALGALNRITSAEFGDPCDVLFISSPIDDPNNQDRVWLD